MSTLPPTLAPNVEDLTREYRARLAELALSQYRNEEIVEEWLGYVVPGLMPKTATDWRRFCNHLLEWLRLNKVHILTMTRREVNLYVQWLEVGQYEGRRGKTPLKPAVILHHMTTGSLLFRYLRDVRGLMAVDPFADAGKTYKKNHRSELRPDLRAVDENDVGVILQGAQTLDDFTMELGLFKTGARCAEMASARRDMIDWKARIIHATPHRKRTFNKLLFDEEFEHFLRLKLERNDRLWPGNPYIWPSPKIPGGHIDPDTVVVWVTEMVKNSPLGATITDWTDPQQKIKPHTNRRGFTSVLKRRGCPSHVVATLRGDSLLTRSELTPDPTQGIYTKYGKLDGVSELRYWYDKCMPQVGARETWERICPRVVDAASVDDLLRSIGGSRF